MSPIAFVMRTGPPVDRASFRYLAIALGLSRYFAAKASAVGVIFFPITFTSPSLSAGSRSSPKMKHRLAIARVYPIVAHIILSGATLDGVPPAIANREFALAVL